MPSTTSDRQNPGPTRGLVRRLSSRFSAIRPEARWAIGATAIFTAAQLVFLFVGCRWDLCADEAEYWAWSRRLDWSYLAKGPLIAVVIRIGTTVFSDLSLALTGTLMPAVRLPALILGVLTAWGVFQLTRLTTGRPRAGLYALLLLPAVPLFRIGGLLMTIDTPLLCCWAWAAVWSYRAIVERKARGWVVAGVLGALGVLAKYTMLAFPASIGLFLLLSRAHRRELIRPGFWGMSALTALGLAPIAVWNASHGWVGAHQMADRVGLFSRWNWGRLMPLVNFLGSEVAVWGLVWWVVGLAALRAVGLAALRGDRPAITGPEGKTLTIHGGVDRSGLLYLLCLWATIWSACVAVCFLGETEANWGAPGYVAVLAMIGWWLDQGPLRRGLRPLSTRPARALVACWAVSMVGLTLLQHTEWIYPALHALIPRPTDRWPAPLKDLDPSCRMHGHREVAAEVARRLAALRAAGLDPFVITPTPYLASELSFYIEGHPEVHTLAFSYTPDRPVNQHDLWHPNPRFDLAPFAGRPALIVEDAHPRPSYAEALVRHGWFGSFEPSTRLVVQQGGEPVCAWDVTLDHDYRGLAGQRATVPPYLQSARP